MQLISLNTLGGRYFKPLIDFILKQSTKTDIFCFQEIFNSKDKTEYQVDFQPNLFESLQSLLTDFQPGYFSEIFFGLDNNWNPVNYDLHLGNAIFIKKNLKIVNKSTINLFLKPTSELNSDWSDFPTILQSCTLQSSSKEFSIFNYHGPFHPGNKLDTQTRLDRSKDILEALPVSKVILTGDFNLLPTTKSIKLLETKLDNQIKKFSITNTRGSLNPYFGTPDEQKFADYIFTQGIETTNLVVPDAKISDHCPLILEFNP